MDLEDLTSETLDGKPERIELDMSGKILLRAFEIRSIVSLAMKASAYGGKVYLLNASRHLRQELRYCAVDSLISYRASRG